MSGTHLVAALVLAAAAAAQGTERVSLGPSGQEAAFGSTGLWGIDISADGAQVTFSTFDPALVPGDTNGKIDVLVRDRVAETTVLVSVAGDGTQANDTSWWSTLSGDGRFVAFQSLATNLDPADTDDNHDVYLHDRDADEDGVLDEPGATTTTLVSRGLGGARSDGESIFPVLSADGRFVAFASGATNLVPNDGNGLFDVFLYARETGVTTLVSEPVVGADANGASSPYHAPAISADGRYVAFGSAATNLVVADGNEEQDVFVRDVLLGVTTRVSVPDDFIHAVGGASYGPALSADGRFVAFTSEATNLVPGGDANGPAPDVFVHDRELGATRLLSRSAGGVQGDMESGSGGCALSADGRYLAFGSLATNLVCCDLNQANDLFLVDRDADADGVFDEDGALAVERLSLDGTAGQVSEPSAVGSPPRLADDGRLALFTSDSDDLVPDDGNGRPDVFLRDRATAFEDVGAALAGAAGPPVLAGSGRLLGGDPFALRLACAAEGSVAALAVGVFPLHAPFKGGLFVPAPNLLLGGLATGAPEVGGDLVLLATWPAGLPPGLETWYQIWLPDAAGPKGWAASNALRAETP